MYFCCKTFNRGKYYVKANDIGYIDEYENNIVFNYYLKNKKYNIKDKKDHFEILNEETYSKYFKSYPFSNLDDYLKHYQPKYIKLIKEVETFSTELISSSSISEEEKGILKTKIKQISQTQGCTKSYTIDECEQITTNSINVKKKGSQIFNRANRYDKPISNHSKENFEDSLSYPFPEGIRLKDYASPKQYSLTIIKLIKNCFEIYDSEIHEIFTKFIDEIFISKKSKIREFYDKYKLDKLYKKKIREFYDELDQEYIICIKEIIQSTQICHFCNEPLEKDDLNSNGYCSQTNKSELCHRDPNKYSTYDNVYWGHGKCNRRQSNNTEYEIILQGLKLLCNNPKYKKKEKVSNLLLLLKLNQKT